MTEFTCERCQTEVVVAAPLPDDRPLCLTCRFFLENPIECPGFEARVLKWMNRGRPALRLVTLGKGSCQGEKDGEDA